MTEMMELAKYIRKELSTADMYAYEAVKHKTQFPELAHHYSRVAQEHVSIADQLHQGGQRLVDDAKRSGHSDAERMRSVWAFETEMAMDQRECIQRKMEMFKA